VIKVVRRKKRRLKIKRKRRNPCPSTVNLTHLLLKLLKTKDKKSLRLQKLNKKRKRVSLKKSLRRLLMLNYQKLTL
jgi:hypothetical protein